MESKPIKYKGMCRVVLGNEVGLKMSTLSFL
jgi:hypothetical protein